jgi:hypothetical protein
MVSEKKLKVVLEYVPGRLLGLIGNPNIGGRPFI